MGIVKWHAGLEPPRTRFVRDRIAESDDREYIYDLLQLERMYKPGHLAWNIATGYLNHQFKRAYPVECEAIYAELNDGLYMDPAAFRVAQKAQREGAARNQALAEAALREEEAKRQQSERAFWERIKRGEWPGEYV